MKYRVMITSLYRGDYNEGLNYYFAKQGERRLYCDAMMSAEASCKYMLANYDIDEIVTFGTKSTFDEGDDLVPIVLKEGKSFYASDTNSLSTYSLLRYRLAEYIDEIDIEKQDLRDLVDTEVQDRLEDFLKKFFREKVNTDGNHKFNKFFDILAQDKNLRNELIDSLKNEMGESADFSNYIRWVANYLNEEMKDSSKFEALDSNDDVKVRFISLQKGKGIMLDRLVSCLHEIAAAEEEREVELYMCLQSDDITDSFILVNLMDALKAFPNSNLDLVKIVTTTKDQDELANCISDSTETFGISELLAGTRAFLRYGKTDILLDYWNRMGVRNEYIERVLYAMRNIDIGISLCDISDIERGIASLRNLLKTNREISSATTFTEYFFTYIGQAIIDDYGRLLETEEIEFIDLVKWAYRKEFWQQTLTIIESRAPKDFIEKGIYYYCSNEEEKETAINTFGQIYYDLKPFEKYKLDNIPHYFVKFYCRSAVSQKKDKRVYQREYAKFRIKQINDPDEGCIRSHTVCPDIDALLNLLFAYYYLGDVRNITNHAQEDEFGMETVMKDSDSSDRMNTIKQSVDLFITNYDKVLDILPEVDREKEIIEIDGSDLAAYVKMKRAEERAQRNEYYHKTEQSRDIKPDKKRSK